MNQYKITVSVGWRLKVKINFKTTFYFTRVYPWITHSVSRPTLCSLFIILIITMTQKAFVLSFKGKYRHVPLYQVYNKTNYFNIFTPVFYENQLPVTSRVSSKLLDYNSSFQLLTQAEETQKQKHFHYLVEIIMLSSYCYQDFSFTHNLLMFVLKCKQKTLSLFVRWQSGQ